MNKYGNEYIPPNKFLSLYSKNNRAKFNDKLFENNIDDMADCLERTILDIQNQQQSYFNITVLDIERIYDYSKIKNTLRQYEQERIKSKKIQNYYDYIDLRESDIFLLKTTFLIQKYGSQFIEIPGEDKKLKERRVDYPELTCTSLLMVPRFVDKYYFKLSGNRYMPFYQIVDGSTYNNTNTKSSKAIPFVNLKTLYMANMISRSFYPITDTNGQSYDACTYICHSFNKSVHVCEYFLAEYGFNASQDFLFGRCDIVWASKTDPHTDKLITFNVNKNLYISVNKDLFLKEYVVQAYTYSVVSRSKFMKLDDVINQSSWLINLGDRFGNASISKGICVSNSIKYGILDETTKRTLRLPESEKRNIYKVFRWMLFEYSELRKKDNIDLSTKRVRSCSEYITAVYANKLNTNLNMMHSRGNKVSIMNIKNALCIQPDFIMKSIRAVNSPLKNVIEYDSFKNDLDAILNLKYTYMGPSGIGEGNKSFAPPEYTNTTLTSIGILDPAYKNKSNPGLSGLLCPLTDISPDGFFDKNYKEPFGNRDNFISNYNNGDGISLFEIENNPNGLDSFDNNNYANDKLKELINTEEIEFTNINTEAIDELPDMFEIKEEEKD